MIIGCGIVDLGGAALQIFTVLITKYVPSDSVISLFTRLVCAYVNVLQCSRQCCSELCFNQIVVCPVIILVTFYSMECSSETRASVLESECNPEEGTHACISNT